MGDYDMYSTVKKSCQLKLSLNSRLNGFSKKFFNNASLELLEQLDSQLEDLSHRHQIISKLAYSKWCEDKQRKSLDNWLDAEQDFNLMQFCNISKQFCNVDMQFMQPYQL